MEATHEILSHIFNDIPSHESYSKIEPINKGVSGDRKYCVETTSGRRLLLRVSDIESYGRKKVMYEMMERVAALGVPMSLPVSFGTCNDGKSVYQLLSWCEGDTAEVLLPSLSKTEQYELGLKAGKSLRMIHSIPAPDGLEDWYDRFALINDGRLRSFNVCDIPIDVSDKILAYYEENSHLLHGRPQTFLHGDYHNENIIISKNHDIAIVDWDLLDSLYGDPWSEFNSILHTTLVPHFTSGLLRGYFGGEPPAEFWRIFALYLSTGALMLVSWAFYVEPRFLEECRQTVLNVMHWFDGMRSPVPSWYLGGTK